MGAAWRAQPGWVLEGAATSLEGCAAIAAALEGCRLVLLTATTQEATPLLTALDQQKRYEVVTKVVITGLLRCGGSGRSAAAAGSAPIPAAVAVGGCDKSNTAQMLTCILQAIDPQPELVMQVGIAGAFVRRDGLAARPGDVVLAEEEVYADSGSSSPEGWLSADELGLPVGMGTGCGSGIRFPIDRELVHAAVAAVAGTGRFAMEESGGAGPRVLSGRLLTASRVTGLLSEADELAERWDALAESMEGAAAAHVCALYGAPFLEVRGISNLIVDRERASWEVERAIEAAAQAALAICGALPSSPNAVGGRGRADRRGST